MSGRVRISQEKALELIRKGICREEDFIGLSKPKYFVRGDDLMYKCLRCFYKGSSFMGIQSHIRKHKNQDLKAEGTRKLWRL